jgi:lipopolysaccharide transport system ATP-binding protein
MSLLSVEALSKTYARDLRRSIVHGLGDIARELNPLRRGVRALRPGEFHVLEDVSFELQRGEALGVVGGNGAGKTTLLKLIAGLIKPDSGTIRRPASVEPLIELGAGFEPLLSGRENIALRAALVGIRGDAKRRLLDGVLAFSGLEPFIDAPLQTYSSGMRARLGFALSTELEPELLLVDEVLAVGDLDFQRKCATRVLAYRRNGGAVLFVSHNVFHVQALCARAIVLHGGRIAFEGGAHEALVHMIDLQHEETTPQGATRATQAAGASHDAISITGVSFRPETGDRLRTGDAARISVNVHSERRIDIRWGFAIWSADHWVCVAGESARDVRQLGPGETNLEGVVPHLPLMLGRYAIRAAVIDAETGLVVARWGWDELPLEIAVGAGDNPVHTASAQLEPLVTINVDWL